jgi:hypothetical protein
MDLSVAGIGTLAGTPLQGAGVIITGPTSWFGITDAFGKAKDIDGNVPELIYGNYNALLSLFSYKDNIISFNVPETIKLNVVMSKLLLTIMESFDHNEPPIMNILQLMETFDHGEPSIMNILQFMESFDN